MVARTARTALEKAASTGLAPIKPKVVQPASRQAKALRQAAVAYLKRNPGVCARVVDEYQEPYVFSWVRWSELERGLKVRWHVAEEVELSSGQKVTQIGRPSNPLLEAREGILCDKTLPGNMRYTFHNSWPTALKIGDAGHMVKTPTP